MNAGPIPCAIREDRDGVKKIVVLIYRTRYEI